MSPAAEYMASSLRRTLVLFTVRQQCEAYGQWNTQKKLQMLFWLLTLFDYFCCPKCKTGLRRL